MDVDSDELRAAESAFNVADVELHKCAPGKQGFGAEKRYSDAYQRLVLLRVRPQIKLKYRTGR